ncbi:bifunctional DNA primase/polymerase [Streptomyces sp. A7024]|uniref:Bifunctional DNA primase/polymerase n=1 Tax=Streptomyces coryli TaxID=1128680 RepID=A0A6G4TUX5_9ACTN|nr:bifunctional DNA primase/polymerase [Streptomyces coryli]NGN63246.1 bifunctional DNA primase/polymerase [Streptomyces coryli]
MAQGKGRNRRFPQWLQRGSTRSAAVASAAGLAAARRSELVLAAAEAGLPLAPAAYPEGYGCSCDRVGCPTPGRHPVSFAWHTQASTEPQRVERWLAAQPEANFITATGRNHDVLDVPLDAGRQALEQLEADGVAVGPVAQAGESPLTGRMLFFTTTRGTPEDEDEWWPCELDCHPETMDEHPGLRWHCRGSYALVPPARLPGGESVEWVRGPELALPDPLTLLETLTDACATYMGREEAAEQAAWPMG